MGTIENIRAVSRSHNTRSRSLLRPSRFESMNREATDNRQFRLNVLHWLTGLLYASIET
jgi:hypothetical protein